MSAEAVRVACGAAADGAFAAAWGAPVTPAELELRVWAHWPDRARLALLLREQPALRPAALTPPLLAALDAPPAALLADARRPVAAPVAAVALAEAEVAADVACLRAADALDRALAALGVTAREEGAEQWGAPRACAAPSDAACR